MPETLTRFLPRDVAIDDLAWFGWQAGAVLGAVLIACLAHALLFRILKRLESHRRMHILKHLVPHTEGPSRLFFIAFAMNMALFLVALPKGWMPRARVLLDVLGIVSIGWTLMGATLGASEWLQHRYGEHQETLRYRSINTQLRVFTHVAVFLVWLFTAITVVMAIPHLRSIGVSLFASAGVAGIVIGMSATPALSNVIAGIQLALTQPIRIGDQITLGNVAGIVGSVSGVVEEIDSTYVVVRLWDQRRLIVPLNYFIQNQFQNWTHTLDGSVIARVDFFLDWNVPIEPVRKELASILKTLPLWDGHISALEAVDMTSGKMVQLRASAGTASAADVYTLQNQMREALLVFIQQSLNRKQPQAA